MCPVIPLILKNFSFELDRVHTFLFSTPSTLPFFIWSFLRWSHHIRSPFYTVSLLLWLPSYDSSTTLFSSLPSSLSFLSVPDKNPFKGGHSMFSFLWIPLFLPRLLFVFWPPETLGSFFSRSFFLVITVSGPLQFICSVRVTLIRRYCLVSQCSSTTFTGTSPKPT